MLVFSSAERTNSLAPSLRPFQMRWYKSKMPPALASKSGSRGKIQQRCCQGRMASSLSHRQMTVKYDNVYLLARRFISFRSGSVRVILYGLLRGKGLTSRQKGTRRKILDEVNYT